MLRHKMNPIKTLVVVLLAMFTLLTVATVSGAATDIQHEARAELTAGKAVVLGIVEGVTEYLPISSSGHLLVTERLLNVGDTAATKDAADTYTIVIQAGAILAVLLLFWKRVVIIFEGLIGRSAEGRRLLVFLLLGFVPAAIVGVAFEHKIKDKLLEPVPVAIAWLVGAAAILVIGSGLHRRGQSSGRGLTEMTNRDALIIGVVQVLALWPGTSRSLVTILAALVLGLSLSAAVEYSFLLGLLTLGAATAKDLASNGKEMFDVYGFVNPTIGFVVAFVSALIAVRWMIGYLQKHDLKIFAYERIIVAVITLALVAAGTI